MLQIPGADASVPLDRAQASELLRRHWRNAVERSLTLARGTRARFGEGYAELQRRYVVVGTSDERQETLVLGFRSAGGSWRLVELGSTP